MAEFPFLWTKSVQSLIQENKISVRAWDRLLVSSHQWQKWRFLFLGCKILVYKESVFVFPGWLIPWVLSRPCCRRSEDSVGWWPFDEQGWLLKPRDLHSSEQGQSSLTCAIDRYPLACSRDSVVGNSTATLLPLGCVYCTILSGSVVLMVKGRGPERGESYLLTYLLSLTPASAPCQAGAGL